MFSAMLYTDGGSRGNPGPAAGAAILFAEDGTQLGRVSQYCGETTNNVAEYTGLIIGLQMAQRKGIDEIDVFLDSELVINQMRSQYVTSNPTLAQKWQEAWTLAKTFQRCDIHHVKRENNRDADKLVNLCLDMTTKADKLQRQIMRKTKAMKKQLTQAEKLLTKDPTKVKLALEEIRTLIEALESSMSFTDGS
jgi:ribonuclease HI